MRAGRLKLSSRRSKSSGVFLIALPEDRLAPWRDAMAAALPGYDIRCPPDGVGERDTVAYILVWKPPPGLLAALPNLKAIFSLGAGVERILADPGLPDGVPVIRVVDADLTRRMSEYVVLHVLLHHRRQRTYDAQQAERLWRPLDQKGAEEVRVGIMGLGALGGDAALRLRDLGFRVAGWTRTPKTLQGVENFAGREALAPFLARTDILVCMLPLTRETQGLLGRDAFAALPRGAAVINVSRGGIVDEAALLQALDSGQVGAAVLDVFATEPLPADHPFWTHERVTVTPHVASITDPVRVSRAIAENIARIEKGKPPRHAVNRARGY